MTKRIRYILLAAVASAGVGAGAQMAAPGGLRAQDVIVAPAKTGTLYNRPGATPAWVCVCGGTECAPCVALPSDEPADPVEDAPDVPDTGA